MIIAVLVALLAAAAVRGSFLVVTVCGTSMEPAYSDGGRVLALRPWARRVRRGGVVVVDAPDLTGGFLIKRVFSVPGDDVPRETFPALDGDTVPAGSVVLRGDNAGHSYDSGQAGYFPVSGIRGVVLRRMSD